MKQLIHTHTSRFLHMDDSKENVPANLQAQTQKRRGGDPGKWIHGMELLRRKVGLVEQECTIPGSLGKISKELALERSELDANLSSCRQGLKDDVAGVNHLVQSVAKMVR